MAEYYTVLKRAVAGLDPSVPETRRAVYDKARNALIGQLKAVDPPLTTAEISRQRLELEEAIRKVERESATGAPVPAAARPPPQQRVQAPPPQRMQPPPRPVEMEPEPPPMAEYDAEEVPQASPQDVFRRAMQEAGIRGAEAAMRSERAPAPIRADVTPYRPPTPSSRPVPRFERPPPPPEIHYEPPEPEAQLAPDYDQDWDRREPPPPPPRSPAVDRRDRPVPPPPRREYAADVDRELIERPARRSRLPAIFLTVLILAVVGGLAALGWSQRGLISELIAGFDSGGTTAGAAKPTAAAPQATAAADDQTGKNTDRLLAGKTADAGNDVRVVTPQPDAAAGDAGAPAAADLPADTGTQPLPMGADAAAPAAATETAASGGDVSAPLKAMLYEEPRRGRRQRRDRDPGEGHLELRSRCVRRPRGRGQPRDPRAQHEGAFRDPQEHRQFAAGEPPRRGGDRYARRFPRQGHQEHSADRPQGRPRSRAASS